MTDDQPAVPGQPGFVRGNERLDQLLADPASSYLTGVILPVDGGWTAH